MKFIMEMWKQVRFWSCRMHLSVFTTSKGSKRKLGLNANSQKHVLLNCVLFIITYSFFVVFVNFRKLRHTFAVAKKFKRVKSKCKTNNIFIVIGFDQNWLKFIKELTVSVDLQSLDFFNWNTHFYYLVTHFL